MIGLALARHVRDFQNVSQQQSPLPTDLCHCHQDHTDSLYITGVIVHYSAFCMPVLAVGPSFLAISPPFFGPILKICVTVEFSEIFYIGHDGWNECLESEIFFRFSVPPFGVLDIRWDETVKRHTFRLYTFHQYHWFAVKTF